MSDGQVVFDIVADDSEFKNAISGLGRSVEESMGKTGKAMQSLGSGISKYVTAPLTAIGVIAGKKTVDFIKLYESAQLVFETMLDGTGPAKALTNELVEMSKASTYSRETLINGGKALVASGVDAKSTTKYMQALTNANALYGGSSQNLVEKAEMFSRVMSKGKVTMMEVNSLQQAGIPVMAILANQYGVTRDEMQDLISKGMVPATEGLDLLTDGMQNGTDGMAGMTAAMDGMAASIKGGTLTGALDSLNSAIRTFSLNLFGMNPQLTESEEGFFENQKAIGQVIAAINTLNGIIASASAVFKPFTELWYQFLDWLIGTNGQLDETGRWVADLENVGGALGKIKDFLDTADPAKLEGIGRGIMGLAAAGPGLIIGGKAISFLGGVIGPAITGLEGLAAGSGKLAPLAGNLLKVLPGVGIAAGLLGAGFLEAKTGMVSGFIDQVPGLLQGLIPMIQSALSTLPTVIADSMTGLGAIVEALVGIIPDVLIAVVDIVLAIVSAIPGMIPTLLAGFVNLLMSIVTAVVEVIPPLLEAIPQIIIAIVELLPTLIPALLMAAVDLLMALIDAIDVIIPILLDAAVMLIMAVVEMIPTLIPAILDAAVQLLMAIVNAIPIIIPRLLTAVVNLIVNVVRIIPTFIGQLITAAISLFMAIVQAVPQVIGALVGAVRNLITSARNVLPGMVSSFATAGRDLIQGIISGVAGGVGALVDSVRNAAKRALDAAKSLLGIKSPSRVFRDAVGKQIIAGWADGIDGNAKGLIASVKNTASAIVDAAATPNLYASLAAAPGGGYALAGMNPSVPSGRYGTAGASTTVYQIGDVSIPASDPAAQKTFEDLARLVRRYSRMGPMEAL